VNVIHITREDGKTWMKGYNTDAPGFIESADFSGHSHALILGTGGAAKAVDYILKKSGLRTLLVSRNPVQSKSIGYPEINRDLLEVYTLVVNATPLGMFPETASCPPFPYEVLDRRHFLYDLV
jgi:shikimate dehydrogenase